MDTFLILLGTLITLVLIGLYLRLGNIISAQKDTNNKLSSMHDADGKKGGTVLLPVTRLEPNAECSTVLPLPIGAEMCAHKMEVVVKEIIRAPHEERAIIICECSKCGAVDKTIATTSQAPKVPIPPIPRSECKHRWVKDKSVTLESAFEQMEEILKQQNEKSKLANPFKKKIGEEEASALKEPVFDPTTAPPWMFRKTLIQTKTCELCGEVDRVVVSNFNTEESEKETEEN